MKGLKQLALATAVAAAPFAQAELTAMDDSFLEEMTGQAGVSIELDTAITIGSITWTDSDGNPLVALGGGTPAEGSLVISGVTFGGSTVAGGAETGADARFDDIKIDIDVDGNDGLVIHLGGTDNLGTFDGTNPVDFGLSVDTVAVSGMTTPLVSNLDIYGNLGPVDIKINNALGADLITVSAYFEVLGGGMDIAVAGLGIRNLTVGQDDNPFANGSYAPVATLGAAQAGTTIGTDNMAHAVLLVGAADATYYDMDALGGGVGAGSVTVTDSMSVTVQSLNIDVGMDVLMGGTSIGSIAIDNLNMSGTNLKIYGH